ncbi:MAG TPA: TetR/AcrR family transcriptional regulator [Bacteroidia bacterium]|nr:TetR/AcrR family transcriptional regulator [Bacteroidia bacterium]
MEANEKILKTSLQMFFKYGIKHVTMDDIAKELGMSKKTIYQFFKEKDDLVNQLCEVEMSRNENEFNHINKSAKDPIHEIMLLSSKMREMLQHINPSFFVDLQKFYPVAFNRFKQFKQNCALENILNNIKQGVEMGIYREDLDVEFAANFRLAQIDMLMFGNYFTFEKTTLAKASQNILEMFVYGISTLKGHKLLDNYKKQHEN